MIRITGHRGAMAYATENTALSFITAEEQAVDEIELDVRLSADGVPVIRHDAHLQDEFGPLVADLSWAEIKEFELPRGQRVLNLSEVLALTSTELQIEVKEPTAATTIAAVLAELLDVALAVGASALYSGWDGLTGLGVDELQRAGIDVGG